MISWQRHGPKFPLVELALWMKSLTTTKFWVGYSELPPEIKKAARKQYRFWQSNPRHPSLQFKPIGELWSVRVTQDYRALAILEDDIYYWIWIGTHTEYDRILKGKQ
jgi:hypothetical protein